MQEKEKPMRRCIGCGVSKPKEELNRMSIFEGKIDTTLNEKKRGKGFYICKGDECIKLAIKKKAFARLLRRKVEDEEIQLVLEAINNAKDR